MKKKCRFCRFTRFIKVLGSLFVLGLLFSACKTKPDLPESAPLVEPLALLVFDGVEAANPERLSLFFTLELGNPLPEPVLVMIDSWRVELNGHKAGSGFSLNRQSGDVLTLNAAPPRMVVNLPPETFPLRLDMDVAALAEQGLAPADDYEAKLILGLGFSMANPQGVDVDNVPQVKVEISGVAPFPGVRPPSFEITSIAILKAELVNTRFRVNMRIENPNPYPVELSAFSYELYGDRRLWADGTERSVFTVPAKSFIGGREVPGSGEATLYLIMNFIDMSRSLLDQIINLVDVNYRFAGEVQVSTGVEYLPKFVTGFDLSGYSKVLER